MKMYILNLDEQIREFPEIWQVRHTESLNGESVLEFMSAKKLSKYEHLIYQDADDIWHEFVVSGVDEQHNESGLTFSVFCESVLTELRGDWIDDRRIVNLPASTALERALETTRWTVGTVDVLGNGTVNFYRESAYSALSKILETYGGELQTRITVTDGKIASRHVDLLTEIGSNNGARFQWSRNAEEIRREIKRDDVITALHGYGRGEEIGDGFGRRLSFADINGGLSYLADEDARQLYGRVSNVKSWESVTDEFDSWAEVAAGADTWADLIDVIPYSRAHRHGSVLFDDVTDAAALKSMTADVLERVSKPAASYSAKVIDFADAGLPRVELGDTVVVIDDDLGIESELRVVEIKRDLLDPTLDEITLGQKGGTIAGALAAQAKIINGLRSVHGVTRMVSEDGKSWIDYSVPEIYLDGDDGNLRIDTDVIFQLHDELGQMVAGFTELGGQKGLFTRFLSNTADGSGGYGAVGWGASGGRGYQFHQGGHNFILTFDVDYGVLLYVDEKPRQWWSADGHTVIYGPNTDVRMALWADGSAQIVDNNGQARYAISPNGTTHIKDANGINRLEVNAEGSLKVFDDDANIRLNLAADGSNHIYHSSGIITFYQDNIQTILQAPVTGGSSIPLTETGATKTVGGVTTDLSDSLEIAVGKLPLDVISFGATGDGTTDDTVAIQLAIAEAISTKQKLYIPAGNYKVSGTEIFELSSDMEIYGDGPASRIFIASNNGNWQSLFYSDPTAVIENVHIHDLHLDCNILNSSPTDTNGWTGTGRVMVFFNLSKNIRLTNNKITYNGFWAFRSKSIGSTISGNAFYFNQTNLTLTDFDTSCVWWGGIHNRITDNNFDSNVIGTWAARTAIENQGHYNIIKGNIVKNFIAGIIITNSTSYENTALGISERGNKNSVIENNILNVQDGINMWLMNTGANSAMENLKIVNNTINTIVTNPARSARGIFIFRPLGDDYVLTNANGPQTGLIKNLHIVGNVLTTSGDNTHIGIDQTPTFDILGAEIRGNTITGYETGMRTGLFTIYNSASQIVDANNNDLLNFTITVNTFKDCQWPIKITKKHKSATITNNHFIQTVAKATGKNTIMLLFLDTGAAYDITWQDNTTDFPATIRPFNPEYPCNFYEFGGLKGRNHVERAVLKIPAISGRTSGVQNIFYKDVVVDVEGSVNVHKRSGSMYGDTLGTLPTTIMNTFTKNSGVTPSRIQVGDAGNIQPYNVLAVDTSKSTLPFNLNVLPVIAVEGSTIHLGWHPTWNGVNPINGCYLKYANNLVNA